jgi:membrane protein
VLGLGDAALAAWSIAKWPVLVVLVVTVMVTVLFWATPNVTGRGFRWVTPGSLLPCWCGWCRLT